jgi:hypothetical protein
LIYFYSSLFPESIRSSVSLSCSLITAQNWKNVATSKQSLWLSLTHVNKNTTPSFHYWEWSCD